MAEVFVFSEEPTIAAELVGCARREGKSASLISLTDPDEYAGCGADSVLHLVGESPRPEGYAKAIADLVQDREAELLLVGSTVTGREIAASVAGYCGAAMASDVLSVGFRPSGVEITRSVCAGAIIRRELLSGFSVATVAAGVFDAADARVDPTIETLPVPIDARVQRVSLEPIPRGDVDLAKADKIVSVGLGLDKEEDLSMVRDLARALNAQVGCTRDVAESRGWLPKAQYIGITGATVSPDLYLAMGVSGQMQHVYGIRGSKVVVAINKDKNAPIFRAADYGIVGDMYVIAPKITAAISRSV